MMSIWIPVHERGRAVTLLWAASYLGAAVGSVWERIEAHVEAEFGYALVYICMGIIGLIWFAILCALVSL